MNWKYVKEPLENSVNTLELLITEIFHQLIESRKPLICFSGDPAVAMGLLPNVTFLEKDASKNGKMFA